MSIAYTAGVLCMRNNELAKEIYITLYRFTYFWRGKQNIQIIFKSKYSKYKEKHFKEHERHNVFKSCFDGFIVQSLRILITLLVS